MVRLATGVTLRYEEFGDPAGTPVVLLHAWGESRRCFDRLVPLLPRSMRVLALDQRGHGDAESPPTGYAVADFAGDVEAFLDELGLAAAVLVGSSSGGYVAQRVAVDSPERVAGLVLLGAPRSLLGRPSFADDIDRLTDPVDRGWVRQSLDWFPRHHDVPADYLEDRVADGARVLARVWRETFYGLLTASPPTDAGRITAPTLVIWGERDELLSRVDQEALAAAAPRGRLVVYGGTGHLVLWEQPARIAADLVDFLTDALG
jgi:rifampin ADP-ribosylating transferase